MAEPASRGATASTASVCMSEANEAIVRPNARASAMPTATPPQTDGGHGSDPNRQGQRRPTEPTGHETDIRTLRLRRRIPYLQRKRPACRGPFPTGTAVPPTQKSSAWLLTARCSLSRGDRLEALCRDGGRTDRPAGNTTGSAPWHRAWWEIGADCSRRHCL